MNAITEQLQQAKGWQDRYKVLLTAGKKTCTLGIRHEENRVHGCQAKTWLQHQACDNKHSFIIDSESALIKGIGEVLSEIANQQHAEAILAIHWDEQLQDLGILNQLSPSRSNGVNALIKAILTKLDENH